MKHWEDQIQLPEKDKEIEYALWMKKDDSPISCSKEQMIRAIRTNKNVKFVAVPEVETFILPGMTYETLEPLLKKRTAELKDSLRINAYIIMLLGFLLFINIIMSDNILAELTDLSNYVLIVVLGILPLVSGTYEIQSMNKTNETNYKKESEEIKFNFWLDQRAVYSVYMIGGVIALLALLQMLIGTEKTIELSGLVKQQVRNGEYWRLCTATVLHGGLIHILFNVVALLIIGRIVVRITSFYHLMTVFMVSAFVGSIMSLLLLPNTTSVGASGGILGLVGFVLIIGLRLKGKIPRNLIKSIVMSISIVAISGIVAIDIIDNAAHLGGLLGGVLMGYLMVGRKHSSIPYPTSSLIKTLGIISTVLFLTTLIAAILPFLIKP